MRIALDTNVLISAFMTRGLSADVLQMVVTEHELMVGATVLSEFERVLRVKFHAPEALVDEAMAFVQSNATLVTATTRLDLEISDQPDGWVLAEAVHGGADLLVTGDRDLLEVAEQAPIPIVTPRGLWTHLRGA